MNRLWHSDYDGDLTYMAAGVLRVDSGRGRIALPRGSQESIIWFILAGEDVNVQDVAISDVIGGSFNFHYDSAP